MESKLNANLHGFTSKNGKRDYDYLKSEGDYLMPIHEEIELVLKAGYLTQQYNSEDKAYSFMKLTEDQTAWNHYDYARKVVFDYAVYLMQNKPELVAFDEEFANLEVDTNIYQAREAMKQKEENETCENKKHVTAEDCLFLASLFTPVLFL